MSTLKMFLTMLAFTFMVGGCIPTSQGTGKAGPETFLRKGTHNVDLDAYSQAITLFKKGQKQEVSMLPPEAFMTPTCTPGRHVGYNRDKIFIVDYKAVKESNLVTSILNSQPNLSMAAPIFVHNKVAPMDGQGFIDHYINLGPELFPGNQMPYLTGDHICAGTTTAENMGGGFSKFRFPIRGSELGQTAIVLPRGPLLAARNQIIICSQMVGVETTFNVPLKGKGRFAGMTNMKCSTWSGEAGYEKMSHTAYQVGFSYEGELYVFVQATTPPVQYPTVPPPTVTYKRS